MAGNSIVLYTLSMTKTRQLLLIDPRLEGWFMMESWMPFAAMIAYLIVIFTLKQIMKNRPALELRGFLIVYNFLQVCCSGYISFEVRFILF